MESILKQSEHKEPPR